MNERAGWYVERLIFIQSPDFRQLFTSIVVKYVDGMGKAIMNFQQAPEGDALVKVQVSANFNNSTRSSAVLLAEGEVATTAPDERNLITLPLQIVERHSQKFSLPFRFLFLQNRTHLTFNRRFQTHFGRWIQNLKKTEKNRQNQQSRDFGQVINGLVTLKLK